MSHAMHGVGPKGRAIIERDAQSISSSFGREYPLVVDRALGSELWDLDGRRYIDLMAGVAVMNVGHRHPHVHQAVKDALDKFWHICLADFYYPQAVELAERLQTIAPMAEDTRIYFGNSGTEAVEAAIKLAMHHTGRREFIGFRGGFHGRTLGALSFTSSKKVQRAFYRKALPVHHIPFPNCYRPLLHQDPDECTADAVLDYLEEIVFDTTVDPNEIAAVVVEPFQGEGGYVPAAAGFFKRLRQICDRHGILLIVDEVQSGVGRTGKWWAIEHEGVEPDIVCFAKGIASGLPLGGIIARKSVMSWKPGAHGSTFGGNPIACAAALATLDVIEEEGLLQHAADAGAYIMSRLREMQTRHPSIGDIRGRGLMIGVEFVRDRATKARAGALRDALNEIGFAKGVLLLPAGNNTMRMTPALNMPRSLIDEGLEIFEAALSEAERRHPYEGSAATAAVTFDCPCGRDPARLAVVPIAAVAAD